MTTFLNNKENVYMFKSLDNLSSPTSYKYVPIRVTNDGTIVGLIKGKYKKIFIGYSDKCFCFNDGPIYDEKHVFVIKNKIKYEELDDLSHNFYSIKEKLKNKKIFWNVKKDQFGIFLYFDCSENLLMEILSFINKNKFNVINFEDGQFDDEFETLKHKYSWRIKFSNLININILWYEVINFINQFNFQKLETQIAEEKINTSQSKKEIKIIKKDIPSPTDLGLNKITKEYKLLRDFIYHQYEKIAFHPSFIETLIKRFSNIDKLSGVLNNINTGKDLRLKKIYKDSNKDGWKEFDEHINDGVSKRARIYLRSSKITNCNYELFLDWKKDEKHQNRVFSKLSKLDAFDSRKVIYQ